MELTKEEEQLIKCLREIDKQNPLGIDAYTESAYIDICLRILSGAASEAGRRYKLFLSESKRQPLVDISEAQRHKQRYEDTRARITEKAEYERDYKRYGMPAPKWTTGADAQKKTKKTRENLSKQDNLK